MPQTSADSMTVLEAGECTMVPEPSSRSYMASKAIQRCQFDRIARPTSK